jgi:hypothetical protein
VLNFLTIFGKEQRVAGMPFFHLIARFVHSLFRSQRQLVLENLALRQQVVMLRQSVRKPRPSVADKLFFCMRDVNKRKHQTTRHPRQTRRQPLPHNPYQPFTGVKHVRFAGYNWKFFVTPPMGPYFFPHPTAYLPASSEGSAYWPNLNHHVITAKLLATGTRPATSGQS